MARIEIGFIWGVIQKVHARGREYKGGKILSRATGTGGRANVPSSKIERVNPRTEHTAATPMQRHFESEKGKRPELNHARDMDDDNHERGALNANAELT